MVATAAPRMTLEGKAHALAAQVEVVGWKDGAGAVYAVPSLSDPGDFHVVVDLARLGVGQGLRCDCVAGVHRQVCAHATAVAVRRQLEAERRRGA